jgi:aminopeptidase-like protein
MYDMLQWAQDLFPIPRSLTGNGVRKTLDYLKAINNELVVHSFRSCRECCGNSLAALSGM